MKPTKLIARGLAFALTAVLMLAMTVQAAPAPEAGPYRVELQPLGAPPVVDATIPVQGRLTDATGRPVPDADYSLTFELRDNGDTALCNAVQFVHTQNGLFDATVWGCDPAIFNGQQLRLAVQVGSDGWMTPTTPIYPVAYAMTLRPGAIVDNNDTGHALRLESASAGMTGSALWAENTGTSGVGVWTKASGSDATVVLENAGTGALLKGYGSDAGSDEFRIDNDGSLQVRPDTELFFPGTMVQKTPAGADLTLLYQANGRVVLDSPVRNERVVQMSLPVPAVLYGQPIEIESVAISCQTDDLYTNTSHVELWKQDADGTPSSLFWSESWMCNTTAGSVYTISSLTGNMLDAGGGALSLEIQVWFDDASDNLTVNWVRLTLDTHDLY